ncbi:MAG: hypothetical protein NTY19_13180 [Planctomycetota bacterium]|nr:hypothetical protein [Planctomycetota bacterium]
MRQFMTGRILCVYGLVWAGALVAAATVRGAVASEQLADQITERVERAVKPLLSPPTASSSVVDFEGLAVTASWTEVWPGPHGTDVTSTVNAKIWNPAIQAALAKQGTIYFPARSEPYYINDPIILKSGQRLWADSKAEIRLVPGANTCMVRNEHLISGQDRPIPADAVPDTQIIVEGGIWTTLATSPAESNGNGQGWPARNQTALHCHGVILFSNVRGIVIRRLVVRQSRAHAVQLSNCSDWLVDGVTFQQHRRDGIHVNGPASYGVIRGIRGVTGDDFIALNAWDWSNTVPSFGSIDHVLVEDVYGDPRLNGTDEIRLLPGTKTFGDGRKLACPVADCVLRNLHDIRTFKVYDQPNLELGRDRDFCDPIGTIKNVYFQRLVFHRPGRFQIAANVAGLAVDDVQLNFDVASAEYRNFKLVEIGPMSETYKIKPADPATWVELFSLDRDVTVRNFGLTNVRGKVGDRLQSLTEAAATLVTIADQKPNPDYPKTTPRGGTGKAIVIR